MLNFSQVLVPVQDPASGCQLSQAADAQGTSRRLDAQDARQAADFRPALRAADTRDAHRAEDTPTQASASPVPLDALPDEALCRLAADGNADAEETLVTRYRQLVRKCARPLFLAGGDSEDLIQEGMVGLLKAVREYDDARDAAFHTFAALCIRTRLSSVLRDSARDKHKPLNQSISFNALGFDSNSYASGTTQLAQRNPEDDLIDREYTAALLSGVRKQLSDFEAKILGYYLDGLSCREIAKLSGKPPKSVDNAVQRIRRKVARRILSGGFSER